MPIQPKTPAIKAASYKSQNLCIVVNTKNFIKSFCNDSIPVEFTKNDKIDDTIQDEALNIPNIDDSEASNDPKSIGKSMTSEILIKVNFSVEKLRSLCKIKRIMAAARILELMVGTIDGN